jgi:hypothetical protein
MDRVIFNIYLKSKNMVNEFYNNAMKKIEEIQADNEDKKNIKNQFIEQLASFSLHLKIKFSPEYETFIEEIERKLRKFISFWDADEVDGFFIKYYKLNIVGDICDFYRFEADKLNEKIL